MKKLFVSAGLVAIGAAAFETAMADNVTSPKYWSVGATLRGFYDDNYNISGNGKGSFGLELQPTISFHEPFQQTDVGMRYNYGLYYYEDRDSVGVNAFDQSHQFDFWVDHAFNERWHANVTDTFAVGQEPELLNPNPVLGVAAPYRINGDNISNHGNIALNTDWTRLFSTSLSYNNGFYDYDNGGAMVVSGGPLGLDIVSPGGVSGATLAGTLDRIEQSVSLDLKWHACPQTTFLVGYQFSWVNYTGDEPVAIVPTASFNPFVYHSSDRDRNGHYIYVGAEHDFTSNLTGMLRVGANYTDSYADPLFPTTSWSPYADLSVTYTYIPGSYVQMGFTHDISSTDQIIADTNGHITQYAEDTVVYVDVNHRITSKLVATVIGRVQYATYEGGAASHNDSTDYSLGINLNYAINQHFSVDAGYNFDDTETGIGGYAYERNRVYFGLTATY